MVTVAAGLVIDLNTSGQGTTASGFRRALAALFRQTSPGVAQAGRLGADQFLVSGSSSGMSYNVSGGGLVIVRSAAGGAYLVGMPSAVSLPAPAANATNPRIDRIYALQPDPALDGLGVSVDLIIDVAVGTPAATPVAPSLPAGALELGRKQIAAGASNTQQGAAFTNIAPITGVNVGLISVAQGGTGASTPLAALENLGVYPRATEPPYADGRIWIKG